MKDEQKLAKRKEEGKVLQEKYKSICEPVNRKEFGFHEHLLTEGQSRDRKVPLIQVWAQGRSWGAL